MDGQEFRKTRETLVAKQKEFKKAKKLKFYAIAATLEFVVRNSESRVEGWILSVIVGVRNKGVSARRELTVLRYTLGVKLM